MATVSRGWRAPWSRSRPLHSALFYSLIHSLTAATAIALVERFYVPYLRKLGSTEQQVGVLTCVPLLMASLAQLISPGVVARSKRRKPLCITAVLLQVFWLLLILGLRSVPGNLRFAAALGLFTLYAVFGTFQTGAWASWMSDLLPDKSRSRYFGWRRQVSLLFSIPIALLAARLLDRSSADVLAGFTAVFAIVLCLRFISAMALWVQYEPPMEKEHHSERASFLGYLRGGGNRMALYAGLYFAGIAFGSRFAGPTLVLYVTEDLALSFKAYVVLGVVGSVSMAATTHFWGHVGGRLGNARVLKLVWPGITLIPALWLVSKNFYYLVGLQVLAGACWGAHFSASWNYILDVSSPETRARYVSYSMGITGIVGAIGPLIGGLLAPHMPPLLGYSRLTILAISVGIRILPGALFLWRLQDVRAVGDVGGIQLVYTFPGARPMIGIYRAVMRRFGHGADE